MNTSKSQFTNKVTEASRNFFSKNDGAIAILFVFFLVPFIIVTAIGIEVGRLIYAETRMAYAVDAATVAIAKYDLDDAQENMETFFYVNVPEQFMGMTLVPSYELTENNTRVTVSVSADMPTIIGKFVNVNFLRANATATALRSLVGVEVALVLDTTGSMLSAGKLNGMKSAAINFVKVVFQNQNTREETAVGIVPYAMTVNVGPDKTSWLKSLSVVNDQNKFPRREPWKGCLKSRDININDLSDTPPIAQADKFDAHFAESTYPYHYWWQAWDNDYQIQNNGSIRVMNSFSYANIGPNLNCVDEIMPLVNNLGQLISKINSLDAYMGGTDGSRIVWGWRLLSPNWNGLWGGESIKSYTAPNNIKAIVMMTDGVNEVPSRNYTGIAVTGYEARANPSVINYNRLSTGQMYGASNQNQATEKINQALANVCQKIKLQGIEIYTVVLQVNDTATQNIYKNCATDSDHYYSPNNISQLYEDFEKIGKSLNRIRIVK